MDFGWYLANLTVRSLGLAALAAAAMWAFRVKSAAARHAVWTVVAGGMLLSAMLAPWLPELPLRVLRAEPAAVALPVAAAPVPMGGVAAPAPSAALPAPVRVRAGSLAAAIYAAGLLFWFARLAFGFAFVRRLVRAGRPIGQPWAKNTFASAWISVPLTVGWLRPKILLPADWEGWPALKLEAVLAHERTHVRRADWAISVLAGLNRCVFWFHPLAWWLERRLALLAEEACDDAALLLVGTEPYAQALLDMAAAVRTSQGRLVWEAMAMAKASEVKKRIERILDETRQIPAAVTRFRWAALVACSLPLIYVATVLKPVPAQAQPQEYPEAAALEQRLAANPHDLDLRRQLILGYFAHNIREPRLSHIDWLIANHPESEVAAAMSSGITARNTAMNDAADYERAAQMWRQQAALHADDARVLRNAGQFLAQPGSDLAEAAQLLVAARALEPHSFIGLDRLAKVYAMAVLSTAGDPIYFDAANSAFGLRVKTELENSTDTILKIQTARAIRDMAGNPDEHPLLVPIVEWAQSLVPARQTPSPAPGFAAPAEPGPAPISKVDPEYPPLARQARLSGIVHLVVTVGSDGHVERLQVQSGHPLLVPPAIEAVKQWVWSPSAAGTFRVDVPFLFDGDGPPFPIASGTSAQPGPSPLSRVDPEYPPLARQARISGTVHLVVTIGADGHVENLEVQSGHPLLVPAAMEAVRQWVWSPSAAGTFRVDVPFTLYGPAPPFPIASGAPAQPGPAPLSKVDPQYPPLARQARISGTVRLVVTVGADGHVERLEVQNGHPLLVPAAMEAVRRWVWSPSAAGTFRVEVPFQLQP